MEHLESVIDADWGATDDKSSALKVAFEVTAAELLKSPESLMGATATKTLTHSKRPVLIVPLGAS